MISIMSPDFNEVRAAKWIGIQSEAPEKQWILEANEATMDFGGVFHSIFIRWAVTINGLHVAAEKYKSEQWKQSGRSFAISGIRNKSDGTGPHLTNVQIWPGEKASDIHSSSIPMLSAWAFCNMYSCLEEFIFKIYRCFLEHHPLTICEGDEFKDLRRAYRKKDESAESRDRWVEAWSNRLESWHRKKLYDGIEKIFLSFINRSNLKIPAAYAKQFQYEDIAKTLGGIALIRNSFIHGATKVSTELEDFCGDFHGLFFKYKTGEDFSITLHELATFEYFTDTLTQTLNTSLIELAHPSIKGLSSSMGTKNVASGTENGA